MTDSLSAAKIERPVSISGQVARQILQYLLSGEIIPGQQLPSERRLASMMGVGRTAIREALQPLILLGLVEVRQGDGTYLRGLESSLLPETVQWGMMLGARPVTDLVEARRYVEVGVAELAAERRDERDLNELKDILEKMRKEESAEEFTRLDIAFHERLAQASRNTVFRGLVSNIRVLLGVWIKRNIEDAGETLPIYKEHPPILEAVAAGDRAKAGQAMADHLDAATGRLRESLQLAIERGETGPGFVSLLSGADRLARTSE
jgi:GntR family transcriptional regulator, transcriptional repressor for pyruvate dehydrogenase complex